MKIHLRNFAYAFIGSVIFYAAQVAVSANEGGWQGKSDIERCRPHGNEVAMVLIEDGRLVCETHERLAYGQAPMLPVVLQSPVKGY